MKRTVAIISLGALLSYCNVPHTSQSGPGTASSRVRWKKSDFGDRGSSDTVMITGVQKIPLLGRNEAGIRADLEGTWTLQTLAGSIIAEKSSINSGLLSKDSISSKRDSITITRIVNGQKETATEVSIERPAAEAKKITPPQGANYHIPEKPRLSFYGSNETFSGFTGCNKIAGRFRIVNPDRISFQNPAPSTKMVCIGDYNEAAFVDALSRVNSFKTGNGQLQLLEGEKVVMVFHRM